MEKLTGPWLLFLVVGGFGFGTYQLWSKTFTRTEAGKRRTIARKDQPVCWFVSTLGWFIVGLVSLMLFAAPRLAR